MLIPLRPSNEHILIVRVPGARDQHGCHSTPFIVCVLRARRAPGHSPSLFQARSFSLREWGLIDLLLRASMTKVEAGVRVEGHGKEPLKTEGSAQALNPMRRDFGVGGSMS